MNNENYDFLTETVLPRIGFGQIFNDDLFVKMKNGGNEFVLAAEADYGKNKVEYTFKFQKSDDKTDDRYFLNVVNAKLTKEDGTTREHEFGLFKQRGFSANEMFNMLDGRYVYKDFHKDGDTVGRWIGVDDKRGGEGTIKKTYYDNTTNFNIVVQLGKIPLVYMPQNSKDELIRDMKAGNFGETNIKTNDGGKQRVKLLVQPHIGKIYVLDMEGKRLNLENKVKVAEGQKFKVKPEGNGTPAAIKKLAEGVNNTQKDGQSEGKPVKIK